MYIQLFIVNYKVEGHEVQQTAPNYLTLHSDPILVRHLKSVLHDCYNIISNNPTPFNNFLIAKTFLFIYVTDSASVLVHVINGEHPAAMQHGNSSAAASLFSNYRVMVGSNLLLLTSITLSPLSSCLCLTISTIFIGIAFR